jgi:phytoene dehydrogenase-like protein
MARVYVYNTALAVVSADVFVGRLQQTLKHAIHYIDGGWHTLVAGLHRAAAAAGVKVSTSVSVAGVQLSDGLARGVRLHDGTELPCSQLVLALPPQDVLRLVADEPEIGAILPAHIACLDLALSQLPAPSHPVVLDLEQPRFMTAQSQFARLAPAHGAVVHVFKQLDARIGHDPIADRADMEALMDRVQPGWRDVVLENRFLPHMLGSGALPLAAQGGLAGRPSHRSRTAANVYFAGDWVGPEGYLADASLSSARASASSILRERVSAVRAA